MVSEHAEAKTDTKRNRVRRIILGVVGTVLLGAIGSGLWDLLFRPGLNETRSWITRLWHSADDAVFASAALDPRPLADLVLMQLLVQVPLCMLTWLLLDVLLMPPLFRFLDVKVEQEGRGYVQRVRARLRWTALVLAMFLLGLYAIGLIGFSIVSDSVVVWRVFDRNLAICAPLLSDSDTRSLTSSFGEMRTRADFERIRDRMNGLARAHGKELEWPR